jgi:hypothetical protein
VGDDDPVLAREPGDLPNRQLEVLELLREGAFLAFANQGVSPSATNKIDFRSGVFMEAIRLPHASLQFLHQDLFQRR